MSPLEFYSQQYHLLRQRLEQLGQDLATIEGTVLKQEVAGLHQWFQTDVLQGTPEDGLEPTLAQRLQAYNVEIDRQLRLLSMDSSFLIAARQAATQEQRRQQASDRLKTLLGYCDTLLRQE